MVHIAEKAFALEKTWMLVLLCTSFCVFQ